jgi:hypothetical protein
MAMRIVTEPGASDARSLGTDAGTGPVFLSTLEGIALSDIVNMRVGCWRPAVHVESRRTSDS